MKVIALVGKKGGVGKTLIAENLFVSAKRKGQAAAIIDLDGQASAALWADRRPYKEDAAAVVTAVSARLGRTLDAARDQGVKLCILDTSARATEAAMEAAKAADLVLLPMRPCLVDLETLADMRALITATSDLRRAFLVLNDAPQRGKRHEEAFGYAEALGIQSCPVVLRHRAPFHDASDRGLGIAEFDPRGGGAKEIDALYRFALKHANPRT